MRLKGRKLVLSDEIESVVAPAPADERDKNTLPTKRSCTTVPRDYWCDHYPTNVIGPAEILTMERRELDAGL
jgi:hypothetical protein